MIRLVLLICFTSLLFVSYSQKKVSLDGGKWDWDGRYLKSTTKSNSWEWDGRYLINKNDLNNKWEWDGRYLKNNLNKTNQYEWDGRYLINLKTKKKLEIDSTVPVPVGALVKGLLN
jgi:hypothetical protein